MKVLHRWTAPLLVVLMGMGARVPPGHADEPAAANPERDAAEARRFVATLRAVVEGRDGAGLLALQSPKARETIREKLRPTYETVRTDPATAAGFLEQFGPSVDLATLTLEEFARHVMRVSLLDPAVRAGVLEPVGVEVLGARREGERLHVHVRSRPDSWFRRRDGTHEVVLVRHESKWTLDVPENVRHFSRLVERVPVDAPADLAGILTDGSTLVVGPTLRGRSRLVFVPFRRPGAVIPWDYDDAVVRSAAVHPDGQHLLVLFDGTYAEDEDDEPVTRWFVASIDLRDGRSRHVREGPALTFEGSPKGLGALIVEPQSRIAWRCPAPGRGCSVAWKTEWDDVSAAAWLAGGEVVVVRESRGDVVVVGPKDGEKRVSIPHRGGNTGALAAHPTEPWLAVPHAEAGAVLYDARDGKELRRLGDLPGVEFLSFSPDGNQLLLVQGARAVRVDVRDGARLGEHRGESAFHGIFWHPKLPLLLAGVREAGDKPSVWVFSVAE